MVRKWLLSSTWMNKGEQEQQRYSALVDETHQIGCYRTDAMNVGTAQRSEDGA